MKTPCISVCVMMPGVDLCMGCGRTIDEIASWSAMTQDAQFTIMASLLSRMTHAGLEPSTALREQLAGIPHVEQK